MLERLQEAVFTWLTVAHPKLGAVGIGPAVLERTNRLFLQLARSTSRRTQRGRYRQLCERLGTSLTASLLPAFEQVPLGVRASVGAVVAENLLPEVDDLPNQLIPNALHGWIPNMKQFLEKNRFERNVFVMVSYRRELGSLIRAVESALIELKLNPVIARDVDITDDLYNPIACLLCCSYGVAIFDRAQVTQKHNPNVVYELGMMQLLKRPCIILKHSGLRRMPTDLLSRLYENYQDTNSAVRGINRWWKRSNAVVGN